MIRIGSRGSALARWQAEHIAAQLRERGYSVSIEILVTTGDRMQAPFLQVDAKGMFTREIEEALLEGRIDLAVHSLKDLPTELGKEFSLAAIPERADARDAFVSVRFNSFAGLPQCAIVGTSSLRRHAQLRGSRPDLDVRELRGNVDTRLGKLEQGQYDAIVLAAAGLDRLRQTELLRERFSSQQMCPAAGQGALAIECRADDAATKGIVAALDHTPTRFAVTLERAALAALEGGCQVPIGIHCDPAENAWRVTGVVARPDGSNILREQIEFDTGDNTMDRARQLGSTVAERLFDRGAAALLAIDVGAPSENFSA